MNLANLLTQNISRHGEYEQLFFIGKTETQTLTNLEIKKRADALADSLEELGLEKGDIVGVMISNRPELSEIMHAVMGMGAAFLPIVYMLTPNEIRYILDDSKVEVIITEKELLPKIEEATENSGTVKKVIVIGENQSEKDTVLPYTAMMKAAEGYRERRIVEMEEEDLAILMYTSGTTGFPKGVMLTHDNLFSNMVSGLDYWPAQKGDRTLISLPLNHIYGTLLLNESLYIGGSTVLFQKFDAQKVLETIREYKVQIAPFVPTMLTMMLQVYRSKEHDLSSIKRMICAGAPLPREVLKKAQTAFNLKIHHGYGCTEASPTISRQRPDLQMKPGSVGHPLPGVTVKICDENGQALASKQEGEIVFKGKNVMKGYLNKPEETAKVLKDGWLFTGDLGMIDEDGDLFITGRKKDLIIKGGENIDPGVIENHFYAHPDVLQAAAVAMPDEKYGEEVCAAVILRPGTQTGEGDLLKFINEKLHHFVAPKRVFFFDEFPATGTGKILKRKIKEVIAQKLTAG